MFLLTEILGSSHDTEMMMRMGASYAPLIIEEGEYYRLFTCMFLHFGIDHLFNNMLLLFFLGEILEGVIGKWRYLTIYMVGGIAANILSLWVELRMSMDMMPVSAGASGAIFAMIGAVVYLLIINEGRLEGLTIERLLIMIGLSLWQGFTSTNVDNVAHIGGLIAGFILAIIIYRKQRKIR